MSPRHRALVCAPLLLSAAPAIAQQAPSPRRDDVVVLGQHADAPSPGSTATVDADTIATRINAVSIEDTLKYLPSLIVRKRNIGDTQAPLATRTSGLGASARSLIYADGALLSALIGNNNGTASPRWSLISPQEVARIDVLYGPFAAEYPGNSIGAVVTITTRLPDRLEASATLARNVQTFSLYGDDRVLPSYQLGATIGDRIGPLSVFASWDHVDSQAQPLTYVTVTTPATTSAAGTPAIGAVPALNRLGAAIRVLGANAIPVQVQDRGKVKLALDLGGVELRYVGGLFLNAMRAGAQSYTRDATTGQPLYAGTFAIDGRAYTVAASAFSGGYYTLDERHWSHSLSASGGGAVTWTAIGTLYDYAHDVQRIPTGALAAGTGGAASGGPGTITRMDGTGWQTFDAKLAWTSGATTLSGGGHIDRFVLKSDRFATTDWIAGDAGALNLQSRGKTRTAALWAQDAWRIAAPLTLTLGGRYEWWRAYDGANYSPPLNVTQPVLDAARFSPKATLAWGFAPHWTARLSAGQAWRFPTVGELYQIVTTPVPAVPNPNLRPERARSEELAIERRDASGGLRVALFNESVADALLSQTALLNGNASTFVQNVDRTRARGVEAAVDRRDLLPRVDLSGSVTYADATTRADAAFPAAIGRTLPQVPRWKATLVGTWRPLDGLSLTAAGRYASRMYGSLDNSDVVGNTYQGFYKYLVVDLRAQVRAGRHLSVGLGVDNVANDRYFLFHPFPQRSFQLDLNWRL